jgi:hypothetical protein
VLCHCVNFMQVAKWLGHSSYVLTLTTYADNIPEVEGEPAARTYCGGGGYERGQVVWVGTRFAIGYAISTTSVAFRMAVRASVSLEVAP